ncbi:MAG: DUF3500 domain-containing protein [Blastocatellia bacterium]
MTKHHSHDSTTSGAHPHDHIPRRTFLSALPAGILAMQAFAQGTVDPAERFRRMSESAERAGLAEPFKGITAAGNPAAGLFPLHSTGVSTAPVRNAATAFLSSLTAEQRAKTMFPVDDPEWRKWMNQHFYVRQGVSFKEMTSAQREAAFGLMRASLSVRGMELTRNIMRLNETLAELTNDHEFMGEWMYFITIMGKPSATEPWGWQFDGHHAIINYFVLGDQVVMTPNFVGSEPVLATSGKYKGTVILQEEQARGLAMAQALNESQKKKAVLNFSKTGNNNLTEAFKDNIVLDYAGVRVSELSARQNRQMIELVNLFISNMDDGHARVKMDEVKRHLDNTCFAWIGTTEADSTFYFRIHSPVVLIEFDHQRPANLSRFTADPTQPTRQHIHVVVRTPNGNDYGKDLLRQHYLAHQHKS